MTFQFHISVSYSILRYSHQILPANFTSSTFISSSMTSLPSIPKASSSSNSLLQAPSLSKPIASKAASNALGEDHNSINTKLIDIPCSFKTDETLSDYSRLFVTSHQSHSAPALKEQARFERKSKEANCREKGLYKGQCNPKYGESTIPHSLSP